MTASPTYSWHSKLLDNICNPWLTTGTTSIHISLHSTIRSNTLNTVGFIQDFFLTFQSVFSKLKSKKKHLVIQSAVNELVEDMATETLSHSVSR